MKRTHCDHCGELVESDAEVWTALRGADDVFGVAGFVGVVWKTARYHNNEQPDLCAECYLVLLWDCGEQAKRRLDTLRAQRAAT